LQKHIESDLGHSVDIINGATPKKSLEIAELKASTARREAEALQNSIEQYKTELEPLQTEYDTKSEYVKTMQKDFSIVGVKAHKDLLGKTKSYTVPAEIWESQRTTQAQKEAVDRATAVYEDMIKTRHNTADMQVALRKENFRLREELECAYVALERMSPSANNEVFKHYHTIKQQRANERLKSPSVDLIKNIDDKLTVDQINYR
jgi:chromosome condensin MukBEF ATPase and DNA-binding subunit MukB